MNIENVRPRSLFIFSQFIHLYFKCFGKIAFQRTGFDRCCKKLKYWWDNTQATHYNALNHERGKDLLMLTYMQFTQYTKPCNVNKIYWCILNLKCFIPVQYRVYSLFWSNHRVKSICWAVFYINCRDF